jgi:hypothetical protein
LLPTIIHARVSLLQVACTASRLLLHCVLLLLLLPLRLLPASA